MEERIFEIKPHTDKNSREFDLFILGKLKELKNIPSNRFNTVVRQVMKKKYSGRLWISEGNTEMWDGIKYQETNYICCPRSQKALSYFCLMLKQEESNITVVNGFLSPV